MLSRVLWLYDVAKEDVALAGGEGATWASSPGPVSPWRPASW